MKAIDNKELILALEELEKEKGIKKEELLESIRTALITAYKRNLLNNQIIGFLNKISQMEKKIDLLYEDKINGTIGEDDFQRMYVNTLQKKEELKKSIEELEKDKEEASREIDLKKIVNNFTEMKEVNRELLVSLIDRITVTEDKKIKIYYKFSILNESNNSHKNNVDTKRTA